MDDVDARHAEDTDDDDAKPWVERLASETALSRVPAHELEGVLDRLEQGETAPPLTADSLRTTMDAVADAVADAEPLRRLVHPSIVQQATASLDEAARANRATWHTGIGDPVTHDEQAEKLEDDQAALDRLSAYLIEHHVEHFGEVAESGHLVDVAIAVMRDQAEKISLLEAEIIEFGEML